MRIVIWGTGAFAKYYMECQCFIEHEIVGFVDTYKNNGIFMGYPVYKPRDIAMLDFDCLIVCVLKHNDMILKTCMDENIVLEKVFFIDQETGFKSVESKCLRQLLCKEKIRNVLPVLYKDIEERQERYDYYNRMPKQEFGDHTLLYRLGKSHVVVWVPIELLFSEKREDDDLAICSQECALPNKKWTDIPIISIESYRSLYRFFMNGLDRPDSYCEWYQKQYTSKGMNSGYTDERLMESSYVGFKRMQYELNNGMDYFIRFPAAAKWNDRGYFNLVGGHHRTAFLYYSGLTRIPVQITQSDYQMWCNKDAAEIVYGMLSGQEGKAWDQIILNPYFLNAYAYKQDEIKSILYHVLEELGFHSFRGKKVVGIGAGTEYVVQAFYRMGAEVFLLETDGECCGLIQEIGNLLYTKCNVVRQRFEEYETTEKYDIAIVRAGDYHYFSDESIREKYIKHINKYINQLLIWQSEECQQEEKKYILKNTKFHNYRHLCQVYSFGKLREIGFFMPDDSEYL